MTDRGDRNARNDNRDSHAPIVIVIHIAPFPTPYDSLLASPSPKFNTKLRRKHDVWYQQKSLCSLDRTRSGEVKLFGSRVDLVRSKLSQYEDSKEGPGLSDHLMSRLQEHRVLQHSMIGHSAIGNNRQEFWSGPRDRAASRVINPVSWGSTCDMHGYEL